MSVLHNRISRRELKARLENDTTPRKTISFYLYTPIPDPVAFRDDWYLQLSGLGVLGRIYVATEGVNAQISVPLAQFEAFRAFLDRQEPFKSLRLNTAVDDSGKSFFVLDVKVKEKIVADGIDEATVIAHCKARLGGVKAPKSVAFVDAIPRTAAGKMDKKALRIPYWGENARMVN